MQLKDEIMFKLTTFIRKIPNEVIIPNFILGGMKWTFFGDFFRFVTEYEIKTSRADLKNDLKKVDS